jgi:hypothetical protein
MKQNEYLKKMNEINIKQTQDKPQVAYSEIKIEALITNVIAKKDKNNKDF